MLYLGYRFGDFMNFNVYLNKNTGEKVTELAKSLHRSRNSIINEALEEWLGKHTNRAWPENFFDFELITDAPDFESYRKHLVDNLLELLGNVTNGEKYIIAKHGVQVAMIIPFNKEEQNIDPVSEAIRSLKNLRKGVTLGKKLSIKEMIQEGRK
jgi:antitoxin (DNA-binding transcriptional repressor) of toxin-antitoxin stability system